MCSCFDCPKNLYVSPLYVVSAMIFASRKFPNRQSERHFSLCRPSTLHQRTGLLESLQLLQSLSGIPVLALCKYQYLLQKRLDWRLSKHSRSQCVGIGFHLRVAKDVIIASLRPGVAYKMRHFVTEKAFQRKRIEALGRLLSYDNLASSIYGSAASNIDAVQSPGGKIDVRGYPTIYSRHLA